ncbi:MAG: FIST signal transduction protein [Blastocatellia bacterium]
MKLATFTYNRTAGWSCESFPAMDSPQTLVTVFGASSFINDTGALSDLGAAFPQAKLTGCSTAGEIMGMTINDDSLVVAVSQFADTRLETACAPVQKADETFAAGEQIARQLHHDNLRGVFILSDGLHVNGSELVRGVNSVLPGSVVVTGGLAADGDRFQNTWILHEGRAEPGYISAVGFYGDAVRIGHGSSGGWDIFGPERKVTRSLGNQLSELDGKPALELYKAYLGDRASELPASALLFPLSLRTGLDNEKRIVRTVVGISEQDQAMIFAGDIPQGAYVQLMRANFDRLIDGASQAAEMTGETPFAGDTLAIAISCVGRRLILGERVEEELEATFEGLPPGTQQVGFYSYGEISPYATGSCDLHNQTMTLTTIHEK